MEEEKILFWTSLKKKEVRGYSNNRVVDGQNHHLNKPSGQSHCSLRRQNILAAFIANNQKVKEVLKDQDENPSDDSTYLFGEMFETHLSQIAKSKKNSK